MPNLQLGKCCNTYLSIFPWSKKNPVISECLAHPFSFFSLSRLPKGTVSSLYQLNPPLIKSIPTSLVAFHHSKHKPNHLLYFHLRTHPKSCKKWTLRWLVFFKCFLNCAHTEKEDRPNQKRHRRFPNRSQSSLCTSWCCKDLSGQRAFIR